MIETPDIDPFDSDKKLNECNCNSYEYKCLIFLDVIITYTREYLENDVKEWIFKKCLMVLNMIIGVFQILLQIYFNIIYFIIKF